MSQDKEIAHLRGRITALNDRIQLLENNLETTQDKIRDDIKRIIKLITPRDLSQDPTTTSTYRGP